MAGLTIGKFAAAEGIGVETVRFYQRRGLLSVPERQGPGYREQLAELAALRCRLRRLIQACERGDGQDCLALSPGQPSASGDAS
jgi:hypothetical protein